MHQKIKDAKGAQDILLEAYEDAVSHPEYGLYGKQSYAHDKESPHCPDHTYFTKQLLHELTKWSVEIHNTHLRILEKAQAA